MSTGGIPIDIIIFAVIAALIVFRLRSVLGRRTGSERPPEGFEPPVHPDAKGNDNVVRLPERGDATEKRDRIHEMAKPGSALEKGFTAIKEKDPSFNADEFMSGAKAAFEMIVEAFAEGKMKPVRMLLSEDVHTNFARAIKTRMDAGETLETSLIGFLKTDIDKARMDGTEALVTVRFTTEQINVTRGTDGEITDGDPDHVAEITDIWTFARDTKNDDPNWGLVETRSPE